MSVRTVGPSRLTTKDNTGKFLRRLQAAKRQATKAMAEEARSQAQQVFQGDGDGQWKANEPSTIEWKGHSKVMQGRSNSGAGTLNQNIEVRDTDEGSKAVGWFPDQPHPDSDLSQAGLAWQHEEDRPWLSQVHDNPVRAAAVVEAGKRAYGRVL